MPEPPERLTPEELNEIEQRANAATPGPWGPHEMHPLSGGGHEWFEVGPYPKSPVAEVTNDYDNFRANAEFIAHARQDVPRLISHIKEVEAERDLLATFVWESNSLRTEDVIRLIEQLPTEEEQT